MRPRCYQRGTRMELGRCFALPPPIPPSAPYSATFLQWLQQQGGERNGGGIWWMSSSQGFTAAREVTSLFCHWKPTFMESFSIHIGLKEKGETSSLPVQGEKVMRSPHCWARTSGWNAQEKPSSGASKRTQHSAVSLPVAREELESHKTKFLSCHNTVAKHTARTFKRMADLQD